MSASLAHALVCHPAAPDACVRAIGVSVLREAAGGLSLAYRLDGDLAALRIPDGTMVLAPERLWAHTCFELFVAVEGERSYREFNFSPSGQWMRFDFDDYRQRSVSPACPAPQLVVRRQGATLELDVQLAAQSLPAGDVCLGLSAVVEHADGSHRYWALRHPAGQPDFHHREGFALALKVPTL